MGGKTPAKQPRQGAVKDAGRGPERVVGGSKEGGKGEGDDTFLGLLVCINGFGISTIVNSPCLW